MLTRIGAAALLALGCTAPATREAPVRAQAPVQVRYAHQRTCGAFMGRAGHFFVYRIVSIANAGAAPFTLDPTQLRILGAAPAFSVPEASDLEVAPGATAPSTEIFLLEHAGTGAPPRGPVDLSYAAAGVAMVRDTTTPAYNAAGGCDNLNT